MDITHPKGIRNVRIEFVRMSDKLDCTPLLGGSTTCVLAGAEVEGVTLHWMAESSASIHFRHRAQVTNSCSVVVSCAGLLNPRHFDWHLNLSTIWTVLITDCNNPLLPNVIIDLDWVAHHSLGQAKITMRRNSGRQKGVCTINWQM